MGEVAGPEPIPAGAPSGAARAVCDGEPGAGWYRGAATCRQNILLIKSMNPCIQFTEFEVGISTFANSQYTILTNYIKLATDINFKSLIVFPIFNQLNLRNSV